MDDERTQASLDALADLFLTGTPPPRHHPIPHPNPQPHRVSQSQPPHPNPLQGPAPIRLRPRPAFTPTPAYNASNGSNTTRTPQAPPQPRLRLYSQGLHEPPPRGDRPETQASDPSRRIGSPEADPPAALVEAVLLGNLPGLAYPWLPQYAQLLAQQDGPVLIISIDEESLDIELIEPAPPPPASSPHAEQSIDLPDLGPDADPVAWLDAMVRLHPTPARTVLLYAPLHDPATANGGDALRRLLAARTWTLLCGADVAAVTAADVLLQNLAQAEPQAAQRQVGLMVMGSDEPAALHAAERFIESARDTLRHQPDLLGWQKRMVPVRRRTLARYDDPDALWHDVEHWLSTLITPTPASNPIPSPLQHADPKQGSKSEASGPSTPTPTPTPTSTPTPDLASYLLQSQTPGSLPGSIPLEARCPHQPQTSLLLDPQGTLHLLRQHTSSPPQDPPLTSLRAAILDLIQARDWVTQHLDLLRLTQRQAHFNPSSPPVLHLFTDRPDLATALTARLGPLLKLHLLQPIHLGTHTGWHHTPLN